MSASTRRLAVRAKCPTVLQMEVVECGAASLSMILGHHGRFVPLTELRYECGVSRDGSKASNILKAARRYGFEARGFKKEIGAVRETAPPFIVFWNFNHFLVVEGWADGKVFLNDPAMGRRTLTDEEFDNGYTGVVLTFTPTETFQKGGQRPSLMPSLKRRLANSVRPLVYCALAGVMLAVPGVCVPVFTQMFVDHVLVQGHDDWLQPLLVGMAVAALLTAALRHLGLRVQTRLRTKLAVAMSGEFLWHVLRLPAGFFAQRFGGEVASRLMVNDRVASIMAGPLAAALVDLALLAAYGLAMLALDPVLAAVVVAFAAFNFLALAAVSGFTGESHTRIELESGKAQGVTIGGLQAIETLKASGLESDFFARWVGTYTKALNLQQGLVRQEQIMSVLPAFLTSLATIGVLVIGGFRVMDGLLSIGMLVAFQSLMGSFMDPVGRLVGLGQTLTALSGDFNRLDDVLSAPVDPQTEGGPALRPDEQDVRLSGAIELRNLTFGYNRLEPPLIEGLNVTLKPGQRVAFVGGSGSGKSTVAKLVTGLYEPWSGEILFDGQPRQAIPRAILNHSIAMVDQDMFLVSGTVRDNLTLWDDTLSDQELVAACQDAEFMDIVAGLPGGLDAPLYEGAVNLSGGQRQRLEIARALSRNPAVLVLDEATSALDSESERRVDQNLRRRGCTCLIVAHRLSTIRDCDEIIVLARGKVVQRGTHDELAAQPGHYAQLLQAEGAERAGASTHA